MNLSSRTGLDVLQDSHVYVTKIGGDNAGKLRDNMETVLMRRENGKKQILAVSAIRSSDASYTDMAHESARDRDSDEQLKEGFNTTSHLIAIAKSLREGDSATARDLLSRIRLFTKEIVGKEAEQDAMLQTSAATAELDSVIDELLNELEAQIGRAEESTLHELKKDWVLEREGSYYSITGVGEQLAQALYRRYFALRELPSVELPIQGLSEELYGTDAPATVESNEQVEEAVAALRTDLRGKMQALLPENDVIISGGYLPVIASQRGYSDKTGALLAQVANDLGQQVAYIIEKEFPIMSDDPRKNDRARVIQEMTYALAMELFGNIRGADGGAIHPAALNMLAEDDIDTVVLNPREELTANSSTYIHHYSPEPNGIEVIASRSVPVAIQVSSTKMFGKPGFFSAVSTWFTERSISIDQVSTSERTTSFTFNNGGFTDAVIHEFNEFLQSTFGPDEELGLEMLKDQSLVFCLGNNMQKTGPAARAALAIHLAGADIHFQTQGLNEQVMTYMVDSKLVREVREKLHRIGIEMDDETFASLLGPIREAVSADAVA
jgi:aspartokinase